MSLQVIATGQLTLKPQKKISQNGNEYVFALLSVPSDHNRISVSAFAFTSDMQKQLLALDKGDEVALSGTATLNQWEKEGEVQCTLNLTVAQVMTAYKFRKKQKSVQESQSDFDDSVDDIE